MEFEDQLLRIPGAGDRTVPQTAKLRQNKYGGEIVRLQNMGDIDKEKRGLGVLDTAIFC